MWFSTRKSTLKRCYMSTLDVEGSLHEDLASLNTRELTLGQCLMSAASVGSALKDHFTLVFHQSVHMGEKPYKCIECGKIWSDLVLGSTAMQVFKIFLNCGTMLVT